MDANRLAAFNAIVEEVRKEIEDGVSGWRDRALLYRIDQQQAEIERLNRAYEVQQTKLKEMGFDYPSCLSVAAWAQRIKDDKDEQKSCTCAKSNWDSLDCPKHGLGVKEGKDGEQG